MLVDCGRGKDGGMYYYPRLRHGGFDRIVMNQYQNSFLDVLLCGKTAKCEEAKVR